MGKLIGISGYQKSGKDTVGRLIQYSLCKQKDKVNVPIEEITDSEQVIYHDWWLEETSDVEIRKFSRKLKIAAGLLLGVSADKFEEQSFKDSKLGPEWNNITVRQFLQDFGTEAVRNHVHQNAWVNALFNNYSEDSQWIITDCRFPNEARAITSRGGIILRVNRPTMTLVDLHLSETSLDKWEFDYVINNDKDLNHLLSEVEKFLELYEAGKINKINSTHDKVHS